MNVLLQIIQSVMPGSRDLRPPLASGLLWALATVVFLGVDVPEDPARGSAWDLLARFESWAGRPTFILVVLIAIYVVGMLAIPAARYLSQILLRIWSIIPFAAGIVGYVTPFGFQRRHRRAVKSARRAVNTKNDRIARATERGGLVTLSNYGYPEQRLSQLESLERKWRNLWVVRTSEAESLVGQFQPGIGLAFLTMVTTEVSRRPTFEHSANEAMTAAFLANGGQVGDLNDFEVRTSMQQAAGIYGRQIHDQLGGLGWSFIRRFDETFYLDIDREQGELDLRSAVGPPAIVLGVELWQVSPIASLVATIAALALTVDSESRSRRLVAAVMSDLQVRGFEIPALDEAARSGRDLAARVRPDIARDPGE